MLTVPTDYADRIDVTPAGCWEWTGSLDTHGYAQVKIDRRSHLVHRLLYVNLIGEPPAGTEFDHLCRTRHCVNPRHLDPVTHRENVLRGEGVAAKAARATHCPKGHPYSGDNLKVFADGKRRCRTCRNEKARLRYAEGVRRDRLARLARGSG